MTEKDLFAAMNYVDDELVAEAETYTAHKVIPMRTVRWLGALAACFCLLVGWAFFAQNGFRATDAFLEESVKSTITEGAVEEVETEEAMQETESAGNGADYRVIAKAFPIFKGKNEILDTNPQNGTLTVAEELQKTVGQCAIVNFAGIPRFLVAFDLYRNEEKIDPNSAEYAAEIQRLTSLGYEFRTLYVKQRDKSIQIRVCGLLTEGLLREKDLSPEYGYYLYFPENEDGSPLDWNNEAQLSGMPTPEDATVTRDYDN